MRLDVRITLDNVSPDVDANQLANIIEDMIRRYTNTEVSTVIYDNDGASSANPILTHNVMKQIRRI